MDKLPFSIYDFFAYLSAGFVLLCGAAAAFVGGSGWQDTPTLMVGLLGVIAAYSAGHVLANISAFLLERLLVGRVLGTPTAVLLSDRPAPRIRHLFPGYFTSLPRNQRDRVLRQARRRADIEIAGPALFYHCFASVKHDDVVMVRLNTFLNLYGFCRNMSLALLVVAAMLGIGTALGSVDTGSAVPVGWWIAGCVAGSLGLLYRYLKFFRHYGSEVFLSYAELPSDRGEHG